MDTKVALITGSSSGIGREIAVSFARLGYQVVIHGTDSMRLGETKKECERACPEGPKVRWVLMDFEKPKLTAETLIRECNRLDVLVNNVGSFKPCRVDSKNAYENFAEMMRINLESAVRLSYLAIPLLRASKGTIVNISSNLSAKCFAGSAGYSAAKAALTMFTKSLAVELAPDVRVNSVSPGPVATLMSTRLGVGQDEFRRTVGSSCLTDRVGEPQDIARLVVFLAAPESSFITGADYIIDGGSTIKPAGELMGAE